jgi:galactose mutarotase-like enzyme
MWVRFSFVALLLLCPDEAGCAGPSQKVFKLTDSGIAALRHVVSGKEVTPSCPVAWSVGVSTLYGGKQDGVDIVIINNGKLQITVVPVRGMGLLSVKMGDVRLGWDSPVKEVVHPKYINLQSRGGLGWLEGFNEFMCRCGMESNGHPGTDKFINNVGDEATMELTLHGRIANLPAQSVELVVDQAPPYRIRLRARVEERMFYGPKLELETELSTEPGSDSFRVADVITNRGAAAQEFEILYHTNFGRPLLGPGASFLAPVERVTPFNANAAKGVSRYGEYQGPTLGFIEQVYCMRLFADAENRTMVLLRNPAVDTAASMAFSTKELPYFTLWKNTAAEADGYVTGLEPGTNYPYNRRLERKAGRVPKLESGESRRMAIDFQIHSGKEAVQWATERIRAIQGDQKTITELEPAKIE